MIGCPGQQFYDGVFSSTLNVIYFSATMYILRSNIRRILLFTPILCIFYVIFLSKIYVKFTPAPFGKLQGTPPFDKLHGTPRYAPTIGGV